MKQSEAKDLRSFLAEPVEEIVVEDAEGAKERLTSLQQTNEVGAQFTSATDPTPFPYGVGARFTSPLRDPISWDDPTLWFHTNSLQDTGAPLQEVGVKFIPPWEGTDAQLQGTGVHFTTPWEGTGGQLHEVGARFTSPLGGTSPLGTNPLETGPRTTDDFTLQQTMPMAQISNMDKVGAPPASPSGPTTQALRPYRLQRYQAQGIPVSLSRSASGTLHMRPASDRGRRETADLAPAPYKIVPGEPSPALQSWERRRRDIYAWLVLLLLFLLVVLGGIGLDSLIASYR